MSGFVKDYIETLEKEPKRKRKEEINSVEAGKELMGCYDPLSTPVLRTLAEEFVLCDRWFSSVPGPTWPNRYYLHAATSDGIADNKKRLPESVPPKELINKALEPGRRLKQGDAAQLLLKVLGSGNDS